jgi:hypothetical protein
LGIGAARLSLSYGKIHRNKWQQRCNNGNFILDNIYLHAKGGGEEPVPSRFESEVLQIMSNDRRPIDASLDRQIAKAKGLGYCHWPVSLNEQDVRVRALEKYGDSLTRTRRRKNFEKIIDHRSIDHHPQSIFILQKSKTDAHIRTSFI